MRQGKKGGVQAFIASPEMLKRRLSALATEAKGHLEGGT